MTHKQISTHSIPVERYGLESVPLTERKTTAFEFAIIQLAFSVNSGNFIVPALAVIEGHLSIPYAIMSTVLGSLLAFWMVSVLTIPGSTYGLPAQYAIRSIIGTVLSRFAASPIRSITSLYWFSVQTVGGTTVIVALINSSTGHRVSFLPVSMILAFIMALLALIGFDAVKKATKVFMPVLIVGQIVILSLFFHHQIQNNDWSNFRITEGFHPGSFLLFASLAFVQYVSGVSSSSDVARYSKTPNHAYWGLFAGNVSGFFMTALLGTMSASLFHQMNPFVASSQISHSSLLIILITLCAMVSMISINLSNAYTGGFSTLNIFPQLGRVKSALLFGMIGILLSCFPIVVDQASTYIRLLGAFVIPLSAIIFVDFISKEKNNLGS